MDLFWTFQKINIDLTRSISLALGFNINALDGHVDKANNTFRSLYYPRIEKEILDAGIRGGEHSDYGSFSILF
jgi:isopenicillin N synthase-like dioxygenase